MHVRIQCLHVAYTRSPTLSHDLVPATRFRTRILPRKRFFADFHKGVDDDLVVTRGVELKEALEKLLKIGFGVDLSLQDHLEHGITKILMWVLRFLLHGDAVHQFRAHDIALVLV